MAHINHAPLLISFAFIFLLAVANAELNVDYYTSTCPYAEEVVRDAVRAAAVDDITVPAALLRLHTHDCFVRGCDGSVLLDSTESNKAEKDGPPNFSLRGFDVVDRAKSTLEVICPGVVSCADILALAARDAVHLSGGPTWEVPKGRKDGRVSNAYETFMLPSPFFNLFELTNAFAQNGLLLEDLVALSGAHTLGFAHCSSFRRRIRRFNATYDVDPSMNRAFATHLRQSCPVHNKNKGAGAMLDFTWTIFDNLYYKLILDGRVILTSDQALLASPESRALVERYAYSTEDFFAAFARSMVNLGNIQEGGEVGKEVRLNCRMVNQEGM